MYMDHDLMLADGVALSGGTSYPATTTGFNVIDQQASPRIGGGDNPAKFCAKLDVAAGTAGAITVALVEDTADPIASATTICSVTFPSGAASGAILAATLPTGVAAERYLGLVVTTVSGATPTITAFIAKDLGTADTELA